MLVRQARLCNCRLQQTVAFKAMRLEQTVRQTIVGHEAMRPKNFKQMGSFQRSHFRDLACAHSANRGAEVEKWVGAQRLALRVRAAGARQAMSCTSALAALPRLPSLLHRSSSYKSAAAHQEPQPSPSRPLPRPTTASLPVHTSARSSFQSSHHFQTPPEHPPDPACLICKDIPRPSASLLQHSARLVCEPAS